MAMGGVTLSKESMWGGVERRWVEGTGGQEGGETVENKNKETVCTTGDFSFKITEASSKCPNMF